MTCGLLGRPQLLESYVWKHTGIRADSKVIIDDGNAIDGFGHFRRQLLRGVVIYGAIERYGPVLDVDIDLGNVDFVCRVNDLNTSSAMRSSVRPEVANSSRAK